MEQEVVFNLTKQLSEMSALLNHLHKEIQELKNENAILKEENEYLKKKLFGRKSETDMIPLK